MKIEKISDSQVKFILNQNDLNERNIKINELAYGSEKMQELFRDMLEQAMYECGFQPENNTPLMIEAIPLSTSSIMIIVTKVSNSDEFESKLNLMPHAKDERKYVKRPIIEHMNSGIIDSEMLIYSFTNLEQATSAAIRLYNKYHGTNSLHKMNGRYYLIAHNDDAYGKIPMSRLDASLCEYGQKHVSTTLSKYYILEHGETIIKKQAIEILSQI